MSKKGNLFNTVKVPSAPRSTFDLSHDVKLSGKMGDLIPIMATPVLPGDKWNISCESLLRFAPLTAPVMHRMDVTMHYFFVPNRLVWYNWEKYITNTKDDLTGELPVHPYLRIQYDDPAQYSKLMDYMGLPNPSQVSTDLFEENFNAIPFAAYQLIYNEYYRDQNLVPLVDHKLNDGNNSANYTGLTTLRKRSWEHDYFTSALPFAQKGESVSIPLGDISLADIPTNPGIIKDPATGAVITGSPLFSSAVTGEMALQQPAGERDAVYDPNGSLVTQPTTINDLRLAMRLQEWLERAARGGSRYVEWIRSMFPSVKSSDARLQRPEYITGTKSPVIISEVLNTTGTVDAPQGNMSGHGVSVTSGQYGDYYAEEHGYIIGIMSIMPKTAYQQGMPKHLIKLGQAEDAYAFPVFANLGEQPVFQREIMAGTSVGENIFGYLPRYAEYKYENNRVAGDFRTTLNFWHLGRIFDTSAPPILNEEFINCDPTTRIFAVEDETDYLWCHVLNKVYASRLLPKYGTPTF